MAFPVTAAQCIGNAVFLTPLGTRDDPLIGMVLAGPVAAGGARIQLYDRTTGGRLLIPAAGVPVADLNFNGGGGAAAGGGALPTYQQRVILVLPSITDVLDVVRNNGDGLAKLMHFRALVPPPHIRYQDTKHDILGYDVLPPQGPNIILAKYHAYRPVIAPPEVRVMLTNFASICV